jgi:hypothetical protein
VSTRDPQQPAIAATSEALGAAEHAFAHGDFAALRTALDALPPELDAASRERAAKLARAVAVDPVHLAILAATALAILVIALRSW